MISEKELLREITRITKEFEDRDCAIERIRVLLAQVLGGTVVLFRPVERGASFLREPEVCEFLESRGFLFKGVYTVPVWTNGRDAGTLVTCFGSGGSAGEILQRVTEHIGRQLGELMDASHLVPGHGERGTAANSIG